jgi:hypothetical protein
MEQEKDDALLLLNDNEQARSLLRRKIRLTLPICLLLIFVFALSAIIVSFVSYIWFDSFVCTRTTYQVDQARPRPELKPIDTARGKRSLSSRKINIPCFGFQCCVTPLDPSEPWKHTRLPKHIQPIDYQLELDLFQLNQPTDLYSGQVIIIVEIKSATADIVLHGMDLIYSDVSVTQHDNINRTDMAVECVIPFPATQTLIIHLSEQLRVGVTYDIRIRFSRTLNIHGTGLFEIQFNKDQYGIE